MIALATLKLGITPPVEVSHPRRPACSTVYVKYFGYCLVSLRIFRHIVSETRSFPFFKYNEGTFTLCWSCEKWAASGTALVI